MHGNNTPHDNFERHSTEHRKHLKKMENGNQVDQAAVPELLIIREVVPPFPLSVEMIFDRPMRTTRTVENSEDRLLFTLSRKNKFRQIFSLK